MMKKLFSYATPIVLMALVAFSCKSDENPGPDPGPGPEDGVGYFSMTLNTSGRTTATRAGETEAGTDEEQEVRNVVVLLYEDNDPDGLLLYKFELDAEKEFGDTEKFKGTDVVDDTHATRPDVDRFVSKARQVEYRDYQMVVLINYKGQGPEIHARNGQIQHIEASLDEGVSTLSELNSMFEGDANQYKNAGFFMSNANGVVPVSKTDLGATDKAAETAPIAVRVDRIVAKIRAYHDFPSTWQPIYDDEAEPSRWTTPDGDVVANLGYTIDKSNMETFLIRQYAAFATSEAGGTGAQETWANSSSTSRQYIYAKDPNYTGLKDANQATIDGAFLSFNGFESTSYENMFPNTNRDPYHGIYALENTMDLDDQKADNYLDYTTNLVVRAQITPKSLIQGESYYSFVNTGGKPKIFTHADIVGWVKDGLPQEYEVDMAGLMELAEDSEIEFDFSENSMEPTQFMTSNGITFHYSGYNYYRVPIKHFQPTGSMADPRLNLYGHFGVVRNNVYNVVVKSLTGPGTGAAVWISADITVNQWWIRDQEEEL